MEGDERFEKVDPAKVEGLRRAFWATQAKAARRLGKSQGTFSRYEVKTLMGWDTWVVMRAEIAFEAFGLTSYPPPSYEELMAMFDGGATKESFRAPDGVPLVVQFKRGEG